LAHAGVTKIHVNCFWKTCRTICFSPEVKRPPRIGMSPVAWTSWASTHISIQNPAPSIRTRLRWSAHSTCRIIAPKLRETSATAISREVGVWSNFGHCWPDSLMSDWVFRASRPAHDRLGELHGDRCPLLVPRHEE